MAEKKRTVPLDALSLLDNVPKPKTTDSENPPKESAPVTEQPKTTEPGKADKPSKEKTTSSIRINTEVKNKAASIAALYGLNFSQGVELALSQLIKLNETNPQAVASLASKYKE